MERLLELLYEILGDYKYTRRSNYIFYCPNCNHSKRKLEVNLKTEQYQCWVCQDTFKGRSIQSLFKRVQASPSQFQKLHSIVGSKYSYRQEEESSSNLSLPKEYNPLWIPSKLPQYRAALDYCFKRGLLPEDILKYRIGYCFEGRYNKRLVIPSYDSQGLLNFFITKGYYKEIGYVNCPVDRDNIIFNEYMVNWKLPIILVEGFFDSIAIKRNVIPLLGKSIGTKLATKIVTEKVRDIFIGLDPDARKHSIKHVEHFMKEGLNVYFIDLQDKDPNDEGFSNMIRRMKELKPVTYSDLVKYKWEL